MSKMHQRLEEMAGITADDPSAAMKEVFVAVDEELRKDATIDAELSGTTAVVCLCRYYAKTPNTVRCPSADAHPRSWAVFLSAHLLSAPSLSRSLSLSQRRARARDRVLLRAFPAPTTRRLFRRAPPLRPSGSVAPTRCGAAPAS
eukprot:3962543-Pleurochrysis_carterae.AAC.1